MTSLATPDHGDAVLASIGIRIEGPGLGDVQAACARIARRIHGERLRVVGFVPSNDRVAVPPVIVHLGLSLCDLTGATVAVVDANVRYPGLAEIAKAQRTTRGPRGAGPGGAASEPPRPRVTDPSGSASEPTRPRVTDPSGSASEPTREVFTTRWLRGSLALLSAPRVERAGDVVPQLSRVLSAGSDLFAHVLVDLTGFELLGEHAAAAASMDAVAIVGQAHQSRERELVELARLMPRGRFLGVLLVG